MTQKDRMSKLRNLFQERNKAQEGYHEAQEAMKLAETNFNRAVVAFENFKADLIGDLFNGCYGEEWLL